MTPAGRHSLNKCPHCGGSPRYGLDRHIMWCPKRPQPVVVEQLAVEVRREEPVGMTCPKCGKALKARGAHFHIRACKGGDG